MIPPNAPGPAGFCTVQPGRHRESLDLSFPIWPVGALLGSLVSLSIGTSFAKSLFPAIGAGGTTLYRLVFATLMLMAFWRPWRRRWTWADALPLGLCAVCCP